LVIFLFSILSYLLYGFISAAKHLIYEGSFSTNVIEVIFYSKGKIDLNLMLFSAMSGVALAYLLALGHRFKVINYIGQKIGVTNRYGDGDVWDYFHNLPATEKNDNWVVVRDHKTGLDYYGYVSTWSDPDCPRELVVSEASVSRDGGHLYDVKHVYFSRHEEDISIEVIVKT